MPPQVRENYCSTQWWSNHGAGNGRPTPDIPGNETKIIGNDDVDSQSKQSDDYRR